MRFNIALVVCCLLFCLLQTASAQIIFETLQPDAELESAQFNSFNGVIPRQIAVMDDGRVRFVSQYLPNEGMNNSRLYERSESSLWTFTTLPLFPPEPIVTGFPTSISPDGRYAVSFGFVLEDFTINRGFLYDLNAGPSIEQLPAPLIVDVAGSFFPQAVANNANVAGDWKGFPVSYDRASGLTNFLPEIGFGISSSISADGQTTVGTTRLGGIDVGFVLEGNAVRPLPNSSGASRTVVHDISPNGRYIVGQTGSLFGTPIGAPVVVWDNEKEIYQGSILVPSNRPVAIADDGTVLFEGRTTQPRLDIPEIIGRPYIWRPDWAVPIRLDFWIATLGLNINGIDNPFQNGSFFPEQFSASDAVVTDDELHILAWSEENRSFMGDVSTLITSHYLRIPISPDLEDPSNLNNGSFDDDDLSGWVASGPGTAAAVDGPDGSAAKLTTGSPVELSQPILEPEYGLTLTFDYQFLTTTGTLDVLLANDSDEQRYLAIEAPLVLVEELQTASVEISATELPENPIGFSVIQLAFSFDGPTGSQILIDNVSVTYAVPEPGTLCLTAIAMLLVAKRRSR